MKDVSLAAREHVRAKLDPLAYRPEKKETRLSD
jgi:hypothetical protein